MPATHAQDLKRTYSQVAKGYEQRNADNLDTESLQKFVKKIQKGGKILDLGAGNGRDSQWLADRGFEVTMFDLSPDMLKIAQQKVPTAKVVQGDMTEMEFAADSFEGVWASASILHVTKQEAQAVIKKVFKMLKDNGQFYCLLKKGEGEFELEEDKYGQPMKRFFAFYSQDEVEDMIKAAGFTILDSQVSQSSSGQEWVDLWAEKKLISY